MECHCFFRNLPPSFNAVSMGDFLLTLATHITGKVPYELLEGVDKEVRRVFPEASEY